LASRISAGGTEAPPQMKSRIDGRREPTLRAEASSCCRKGVAPAMKVQPSLSMIFTPSSASQTSCSTPWRPKRTGMSKAYIEPPIWPTGEGMRKRSLPLIRQWRFTCTQTASDELCVWITPLARPVVPEV